MIYNAQLLLAVAATTLIARATPLDIIRPQTYSSAKIVAAETFAEDDAEYGEFFLDETRPRTLDEIVPDDDDDEYEDDTDDITVKIVGGREVKPAFKYSPWAVAISRRDYQFCAGTLFAKNLMVTAGHCSVLGIPLGSLRVSVHRHDLSLSTSAEKGVDLGVKQITVHPDFDASTLDSDIAVWHLTGGENLNTTSYVRLDNGKNSYPGRSGTVLGWGALDEGGMPSDVLMELEVEMKGNDECRKVLGQSAITDSMLCAGGVKGRDACQGDSGGPMVVMRNEPRPVLTGVVSWGVGCARKNYPGVYTRVSMFRSWLREFLPEAERADFDADSADSGDSLFVVQN